MFKSLAQVASPLIATTILMIGFGVAGYITPLRAMDEGWSTFAVSLIGTAYSVGFFFSSIGTPYMVRRVGHIRVFSAFIAILIVAILAASLVVDWRLWMVFRALAGFAMAGVYMVIETWLNERSENAWRGAMMSVYMIVASLAAAGGNFLVPLGDRADSSLFILAAVLYAVALLPMALSASPQPAPFTELRINLGGLWRNTPVAFVGSVLTGLLNAGWLHMAAVYATKNGMDAQGGAELQAAVMAGMLIFQMPLGRLSDRFDRRAVMVASGLIGVVACAAMVAVPVSHWWAFNTAAFLLGAVLFPIYSLNVAHANDRAGPGEYVEIAASMAFLYGIGVIVGPLATGTAMSLIGPTGMPWLLGIGFAIYGGYAFYRILRRAKPVDMRSDFPSAASPLTGSGINPSSQDRG